MKNIISIVEFSAVFSIIWLFNERFQIPKLNNKSLVLQFPNTFKLELFVSKYKIHSKLAKLRQREKLSFVTIRTSWPWSVSKVNCWQINIRMRNKSRFHSQEPLETCRVRAAARRRNYLIMRRSQTFPWVLYPRSRYRSQDFRKLSLIWYSLDF